MNPAKTSIVATAFACAALFSVASAQAAAAGAVDTAGALAAGAIGTAGAIAAVRRRTLCRQRLLRVERLG